MPYNYKTELGRYRKYYQSLEPVLKRKSSRMYTSVIFSFLAVSLFSWYAVRPTIQTILRLRREIQDNIVINKQMEDKISALIEAQAFYQEIQPFLPAVNQALPPDPDAVPLVIQLRNLASASGVLIMSLQPAATPLLGSTTDETTTPKTPVVNTKQQAYDISVSVQGPYTNVLSYLQGLLTMRRIVTITGVAVTPVEKIKTASSSATAVTNALQLAIRLKSYYLVE
jgi:Tfp pilus assembly protein PilO